MKNIVKMAMVLFLSVLVLGSVFAGGGRDTGQAAAGGTLRYWSCFTGDSRTWEEWRVDEFRKAYPNITIELQSVPESAGINNGMLLAAIASGTAPDLIVADDYISAYGFAAQGAFVPWDPYLPAINLSIQDFMPGFQSVMVYRGVLTLYRKTPTLLCSISTRIWPEQPVLIT